MNKLSLQIIIKDAELQTAIKIARMLMVDTSITVKQFTPIVQLENDLLKELNTLREQQIGVINNEIQFLRGLHK